MDEIRDYRPEDREEILELWKKQGFEYDFPDLDKMIELIVIVIDGKIRVAVGARPTVELYAWADNEWGTPGLRDDLMHKIYGPVRQALYDRGIQDGHSFLPPQICKAFGRRMKKKYRWIKSTWDCYVGFTGR